MELNSYKIANENKYFIKAILSMKCFICINEKDLLIEKKINDKDVFLCEYCHEESENG